MYPILVVPSPFDKLIFLPVELTSNMNKIFREFIEALDLFVGRYLVLIASGYIIVKVLHFKVFPDFP
jgi:hypothetical protein